MDSCQPLGFGGPANRTKEAKDGWDAVMRAPFCPGKHYEDWEIADPAGESIEAVRAIRDEIRGRVENLIAELMASGASS
jgi:protein-tyrosine-phosphatase